MKKRGDKFDLSEICSVQYFHVVDARQYVESSQQLPTFVVVLLTYDVSKKKDNRSSDIKE